MDFDWQILWCGFSYSNLFFFWVWWFYCWELTHFFLWTSSFLLNSRHVRQEFSCCPRDYFKNPLPKICSLALEQKREEEQISLGFLVFQSIHNLTRLPNFYPGITSPKRNLISSRIHRSRELDSLKSPSRRFTLKADTLRWDLHSLFMCTKLNSLLLRSD